MTKKTLEKRKKFVFFKNYINFVTFFTNIIIIATFSLTNDAKFTIFVKNDFSWRLFCDNFLKRRGMYSIASFLHLSPNFLLNLYQTLQFFATQVYKWRDLVHITTFSENFGPKISRKVNFLLVTFFLFY